MFDGKKTVNNAGGRYWMVFKISAANNKEREISLLI